MIDLASTRMSPICGERGAALIGYAGDRAHMVSVSADFAHSLSAAIGKTTSIGPSLLVKAVQLDDPSSPGARLVKQEAKRFQKAVGNDIKAAHPELNGAFRSFELILSSADAVEAFTDPKRASFVKPAIKTSKALLSLMNAVEPLVPGLTNNPCFKWASAIVTIGDLAYGIWAEAAPPPSLLGVPASSLR
jgi:hypothetical protein